MKLRLTTTILLLYLGLQAGARTDIPRYDDSARPVIASKGDLVVGGNASLGGHDNSNYSFAVLTGINSVGFKASMAPEFCWFIGDNLGIGGKIGYGRTMLDATSGTLDLGSISMSVKDCKIVSQDLSITAFVRYYLPIGESSRVAMFVDGGLQSTWGTSKESNRNTGSVVGTWQDKWKGGLVVNPGIFAYLNHKVGVFISLGMAGICVNRVSQVHNRVSEGSRNTFTTNFMIDLTALSFGLDINLGKR